MKIKKILISLICKIFLKPKTFSSVPRNVIHIDCKKDQINLITNTSNNVYQIHTEKGNLFFRECKIHKRIHTYVDELIDYYYTEICPSFNEDRLFIEQALAKKTSFKKFVNMGIVNDFSSGVYNFCIGNGAHHIGLPEMHPEMEKRVKRFAQFIWGDLFAYKLNNGLKIGEYQTYNAVRCIAFSRIAKKIGVENLIPNTEYAFVTVEEKTMFGTLMQEVEGISTEHTTYEFRKEICSPDLQRELNKLNLLDVICFEKDHRPGNYNVALDLGKAIGVSAFDNDSPNAFGMGGISFKTYLGCSPLFINGSFNGLYADKSMVESILNIDINDLCNEVTDLLSKFQIYALRYRVKKIKHILKRISPEKLLNDGEWSEVTVKNEVENGKVVTYLIKFLNGRELPYQPWLNN